MITFDNNMKTIYDDGIVAVETSSEIPTDALEEFKRDMAEVHILIDKAKKGIKDGET